MLFYEILIVVLQLVLLVVQDKGPEAALPVMAYQIFRGPVLVWFAASVYFFLIEQTATA